MAIDELARRQAKKAASDARQARADIRALEILIRALTGPCGHPVCPHCASVEPDSIEAREI